jgi:S1-C subfamily serine protease
VSFGLVPDYAYTGAGVRAESVTPGSPAALAGMQAGAVLLALNGRPITNLTQFSDALKSFKPGDTVQATFRQGEQEQQAAVHLVER